MIGAEEQIRQRASAPKGSPPPPPIVLAVMLEVAALTECQQVGAGIVGRIMVEVSAGEEDARARQLHGPSWQGREFRKPATFAVAPGGVLGVPPTPVSQMRH